MAGDLIPPPSPAGRPAARTRARAASSRSAPQPEERPVAPSTEPDRSPRRGRSRPPRHRRRQPTAPTARASGSLLGALIGIGIATLAIGAAVYVGTGADNGAPEGWSSWKPDTDDGVGAANEIATHVGAQVPARRRQPARRRPGERARDLRRPARGRAADRSAGRRHRLHHGGKGLMYTLNGLGPKGSVRGGKPSEERHLLLRREALELALYTFRYVKTSTWWSRCCRPSRRRRPRTRTADDDVDRGPADPGALLPARRPRAAARDPAERHDPGQDAAAGARSRRPSRAASTR